MNIYIELVYEEIQEKSMEMRKKIKTVCRKYNPHHWSVMSFSYSYVVCLCK